MWMVFYTTDLMTTTRTAGMEPGPGVTETRLIPVPSISLYTMIVLGDNEHCCAMPVRSCSRQSVLSLSAPCWPGKRHLDTLVSQCCTIRQLDLPCVSSNEE